MSEPTAWRFAMAGWGLFTLSALAFTVDAWQDGSTLYLVASLLFLLACLVFMVPAWARRPSRRPPGPES
ncbi:MAG: hypothetical protein VYB54_15170 [Pseudomonadota bacterium]|nr:hypothetical protein [Pseudomonadota bacterium]